MGIRVNEEEEDHAERHQVHIDAEDDSGMVVVPPAAHAAHGIGGADYGKRGGDEEQQGSAIVREVGEQDRGKEAGEHQKVAAGQRALAQVEDGWKRGGHDVGFAVPEP